MVIGSSIDESVTVPCRVVGDPSVITFEWTFANSGERFDVTSNNLVPNMAIEEHLGTGNNLNGNSGASSNVNNNNENSNNNNGNNAITTSTRHFNSIEDYNDNNGKYVFVYTNTFGFKLYCYSGLLFVFAIPLNSHIKYDEIIDIQCPKICIIISNGFNKLYLTHKIQKIYIPYYDTRRTCEKHENGKSTNNNNYKLFIRRMLPQRNKLSDPVTIDICDECRSKF